MSLNTALRAAAATAIVTVGLIGQVLLAGPAAAVTAVKSELRQGELRLEGTSAPGIFVVARSTTTTAAVRADLSGAFKIQAADFTAPECLVTITDGRTPIATVALAGCTPSTIQAPPTPAPPTGTCIITSQPPVTLATGVATAVNFDTTGCDITFNSGATPTPVQWAVVAGRIPTGMTGPNSQGTTAGNIIGTPSIPGTYQVTLKVTDQIGATDQENLTINVA